MNSNIIQDNSHYQQYIDFAYLRSKGQNKMILKAGSGSLSKDVKFEQHYSSGIAEGFSLAPYFWHDPIYDAIAQAKFFLSLNSGKALAFNILDFEQWWKSWLSWTQWRQGTISRSQVPVISANLLFDHFVQVHQHMIKNSNLPVITYTADWFLDSYCPQAYDYLKDYYTHWADYTLFSTVKVEKTWEELEVLLPKSNVIPTLPQNYPLDKVIFWQVSGDKFKAQGVYSDTAKTVLSELDINKEVNPVYTWNALANNVIVVNPPPIPEIPPIIPKEFMKQSAKYLYDLDVPYVSQLGTNANEHNNDCGAASAVMIIKAYTGEDVTVDQFYNETGISYDGYLSASQLISVLSKHKVGAKWIISNMQSLMENLRNGKPCICLVSYKTIRDSIATESQFAGFHFMLAIGYDTKNIYVHDPLWTGEGGKEFAIPYAIFEKSWKDAGANPLANPAYGCVVPNFAIAEAIPTAYPKYKVTATVLNVRSTPDSSTSTNIIRKLYYGNIVTISEINSNGWGKIYGNTGWIYMAYTVKV